MAISPDDRRRFERQVAALREAEHNDEGTPEWRAAIARTENDRRAREGLPPLSEWWDRPELEMHRRARALGLLRRVR